ncbi:MAG: outer membrane lipoprotein chaperone LolA, partial [Acidiferrobacteraceae bacterium]
QLLAAAVLAGSPLAHAAASGPLLRFFRDVHSYRAQFTQTVYSHEHEVVQKSRGRMWVLRPDKFRWDYAPPQREIIVGDGKLLWLYDEGLRQVTVQPMARALRGTPAMILSGEGHLSSRFRIRETGSRHGVVWFDLKPKRRGTGFIDIRLGFSGNLLSRLVLVDSFRQTTDIVFTHYQANKEIDPRRFRFSPPRGADVVRE